MNVASEECNSNKTGRAPSHTGEILDYLKDPSADRIISRTSGVPWPAQGPHLNPLGYCFWDHASSIVSKKSNSLSDIMRAVECICADIDSRQIKRVIEMLHSRLLACITSKGDHIQHKLK